MAKIQKKKNIQICSLTAQCSKNFLNEEKNGQSQGKCSSFSSLSCDNEEYFQRNKKIEMRLKVGKLGE